MANEIDGKSKQLAIVIVRVHNGCHNFPKYVSRYISSLKTFVYCMPTLTNRG